MAAGRRRCGRRSARRPCIARAPSRDAREARRLAGARSISSTRTPSTPASSAPTVAARSFLRRLGAEAEDVLDEFLAAGPRLRGGQHPVARRASSPGSTPPTRTIAPRHRLDPRRGAGDDRPRRQGPRGRRSSSWSTTARSRSIPTTIRRSCRSPTTATARPRRWSGRGAPASAPAAVKARIDALRADSEDEYRRLLYVAVTRARPTGSYICGTEKQVGDRDKPKRWHNVITSALGGECVETDEGEGRIALEWRPPAGIVPKAKGKQEAMAFAPQRPPWLAQPAPPAPPPVRRITPSTALAGDGPCAAARAGAGARRPGGAARRGARPPRAPPPPVPAGHRAGPQARHRPPLPRGYGDRRGLDGRGPRCAPRPHPRRPRPSRLRAGLRTGEPGRRSRSPARSAAPTLSGRIDRLAVGDDRVLIVDYKTNRPAPASVADAPHEYGCSSPSTGRCSGGSILRGRSRPQSSGRTTRRSWKFLPSCSTLPEMQAAAGTAE